MLDGRYEKPRHSHTHIHTDTEPLWRVEGLEKLSNTSPKGGATDVTPRNVQNQDEGSGECRRLEEIKAKLCDCIVLFPEGLRI